MKTTVVILAAGLGTRMRSKQAKVLHRAGGRTLVSQPLQLTIIPANAQAANTDAALTNLAFIRLALPKTEVYVGEPFPVEIHLYVQAGE